MKATFIASGLTSITLLLFTFVSCKAWPHTHKHHHGPAHKVHSAMSAISGSGLGHDAFGGSQAGTDFATGIGAAGQSSSFHYGYDRNCTSGLSKPSKVSQSTVSNAGISAGSSLPQSIPNITHNITSSHAAATTTVRLTRKSTIFVTLRPLGSVPSTDTSQTSRNSLPASLLKRVETTTSNIDEVVSSSTAAAVAESSSSVNPFAGGYESFQLGPFSSPTTSSSIAAPSATAVTPLCPSGNNTVFTSSEGQKYKVVCDIDYLNNDLRYILASSLEDCIGRCDTYNAQLVGGLPCIGALFVPSRLYGRDDCYLKASVNNPTPAKLEMAVGLLISSSSTSTSSADPSTTQLESASGSSTLSAAAVATSSAGYAAPAPTVPHASGTLVVVPSVAASHLHGPSSNKPTHQYINWKPPAAPKLASTLLAVGVNNELSTSYPLSLDTGILELNESTQGLLADLNGTPHISRDGGKGGYLNGQHLFIFCDTGSYTAPSDYTNGNFLGFVSSSVAIDTGMNGLAGNALTLEDGIGQWSDDAGRMRGFSPMTQGEQSYNLAMQGDGQRYAIWPESSLIPLDATNSIMYAPIVYDDVNMATKAAVFTYTGATLLTISAGGKGGPLATRTVDKLFGQDEVQWGCIGGIRSWGPSGVGGTDGKVYLFGKVSGGLLLARVNHGDIADLNSYEYWTGHGWDKTMPSTSSNAYFISGNFMDVDVFYSPRHLTFIIVYLNSYADNTFRFRYLDANHAILSPSAPDADPATDYVESLVEHPWSKEQVLYRAFPGLSGKYIYAGGVHQGYYGDDDITNGGTKMLLSWTAPTGEDASSLISEYQIMTAEIEWV